ncbi:MAG: DNA polymerase I [Acholeplasmataceae bacterium]
MKKITLIDGNSILFRAYYATAYPGAKLMQSAKGVYTNAVFAFVGMFEKIVTEETEHVLVAFDTSEPTKRHLAYKEYKAGRAKMPEELAQQIPLIHEYLELNGVKTYSKGGYEADDIIGTVAKEASEKGYQVDIFSSDRDLLQLVDEHITVHLLKKGMQDVHHFTPEMIQETYGLDHTQLIDLKALMGDPSDNIPGIPGVGEKTAIKLLQTYGSLEQVFVHKNEIKGKLGENIREHEELARLSLDLVTILIDSNIEFHPDNIAKTPVQTDDLIRFFQELDLHAFVRKMENNQPSTTDWIYEKLTDEADISSFLNETLAIHFEFSDANYHRADLWGIGLSNGKRHVYLTPELAMNSTAFHTYLKNDNYEKYVYDLKAMQVFLLWHEHSITHVTFDLLLAAYLADSHLGKEEFKRIAANFQYEDVQYDELIYGKGAKKGLPEPEIYEKHIVSKAKATFLLKEEILSVLDEQDQLSLLTDIELPLSYVLAEMEWQGILVDQEELKKQKYDLNARIQKLEADIIALAGEPFNVASPKQLGDILFTKLELPYGKKTKTGYSTNVDVLNKLIDKHPIIAKVLDYRQLTKLYSTYIIGLEQNIFPDGKIHTIYTQALTTTGRLSSLEPNLQNIPVRTEEGRQIRKLFIAHEGKQFVGADYSQIELRVLASMANVERLINAFKEDKDIHTSTAQEIFKVNEVTPDQRRAAKAVNFGIIYGIGSWSLAEDIDVSPTEAQAFIDQYLTLYPEIKQYMTDIVKFAKDNGYVKTIMNRRRYIPELKSPVFAQRAFGERTALNAPIQGSAADVLKKAMIDLAAQIKKEKLDAKILLQVHDELILEVPMHELKLMEKMVPVVMKNAVQLEVELKASSSTGNTWYDLD